MRVNVSNGASVGPEPGVEQLLIVLATMRRVWIPVHNLGAGITDKWFLKKTPEESDGSRTPHENRE